MVCWRAWYSVNFNHDFSTLLPDGQEWFKPRSSVYLRTTARKRVNQWVMDFEPGQDEAAVAFIHQNYPEETARQLLSSLVDTALGRGVCICKSCQPHVEQGHLQRYVPSVHLQPRLCDYVVDPCHVIPVIDNAGTSTYVATERFEEWCSGAAAPASDSVDSVPVLGLGLHVFAEPIAALTDSEEMVLALIHPLVQVYTIPKTGQLAYVGHVCNFRQKVVKFVASLPILPQDMPFVFVRPRVLKTQKSHPAPFKVDVNKVKRAYDWLKAHNPYYANIPWEPSAEEAWKEDD